MSLFIDIKDNRFRTNQEKNELKRSVGNPRFYKFWDSNEDWWGYYGSFILGKIDNFTDLDGVNIIKNTFASHGFSYKTFIFGNHIWVG